MQRAHFAFMFSHRNWENKIQLDMVSAKYKTNSVGYMLSEFITWKPFSWLQTSSNIGYFHTSDFASRLYVYERSMLYNFSFPAFYGKGVRGAIFVKANLHKNLSALLKISNTHYLDRKQISSGLQQISGSNLTDLELQLQWKI